MSEEIDQTKNKSEKWLTPWRDDRLWKFVRTNPALMVSGVILTVVVSVLSIKYESFVKLLGVVFSAQVVIVAFALYFVKTYKEEIRLFIGRIRQLKGLGIEFFAESVSERLTREQTRLPVEDEPPKVSEHMTGNESQVSRSWLFKYLDKGLPVNTLAVLQYIAGEVPDDTLFQAWRRCPGFQVLEKVALDQLVDMGLCYTDDKDQLQVTDVGREYLKRFPEGIKKNIILEFEMSINETLMAWGQREYIAFQGIVKDIRLTKRWQQ